VTIAQAEVNEPTVSGSYTYNGQNQTVTLNGYDSSYMSITGDTAKDAGSHTANVTLDTNYKWAEGSDGSVEWSIAPKAVTVTIDVKSSTYGTDIVALTATDNGIIDGETGVYTLSTTATASSSAGQYDITGESNSTNYTFTFENGINAYTIVAANLSGVAVSLDGWTYGSAPNTPVVTGNAENANVSYQYKVQGTDDTTYSDAVPTGVGNYTVKATIAETNNYNAATATADFTISKATPTVTAPTANTLTYTGEPQELIKAGSTTGGTLQYSTSQDGEYTTSIPTGTDVKDYTVYYKVVGDSNYNDVEPASVNITIAKATPTVTAPTAKTLTYTGEAQALVSVGATTGGTIKYSLDNSTWSAEIPTATDAKEYKVYYKVVGDDNHNDVEPTSITVTIAALAENTPSIAVNYADETLTGFDTDSSYAIGGADVAPTNGTLAAESYIGSEISIVKKASDTNHADSAAQTLTIKPRPTAPTGISATKASDNDTADGTITNVESTMEYKASDADTWLSVTDTQITGLAAGGYKVRYKATQTEFASAAADVNIGVIGIYTITFVNYDNEVLQAINVAVGSMPQYSGEEPIKPNDDKYTYSFAGWEPSVTAVTENATYTAKFDSTPRVYNVTLEANGGTVENADNYKTYSYGTGLILPTPTRDNYYFGGWYDNGDFEGTAVTAVTAEDTGDKTYYAKWTEEEPTEYLITFVNYDNTELQSGMVSVGTLPVYSGETPTKPNDDKYSYTFTGWSSEITEVTGIAVYAAQFERTPIAYNVELTDEGKAVVLAPEAVTDYVLIFAAYDANGMMTGIELKYITFDEAGEKEFEPETLETNGAAKIKVMLWDDVSKMTPKCGSDSMNLQ
ncbi:MAG: InlB B-repeat-containing protein, partial [Clostridia bacterium]